MYNLTEQNEIRNRRSALTMAIMLHLGLAALVYLLTSDTPDNAGAGQSQANVEQTHAPAHPRVVKLP